MLSSPFALLMLAARAAPLTDVVRVNTTMEEKSMSIFKLNGLRTSWGDTFDVVAGTALVIADGGALDADGRSQLVVRALIAHPDNTIGDMTMLVLAIDDALADGCRADLERLIRGGQPRELNRLWIVVGRMVELVRAHRPLDEATTERLIHVVRLFGVHPLMFGLDP